jgi:hypothetical protein
MATWDQFIAAAPQFGEQARDQLGTGIAYLATVRKDGAPRLHPVVPTFADGRLLVAVMGSSPKRFDLAHDGRYSMHALPPLQGGDDYEFNVTGRACRIPAADAATWDAARANAEHVIHDSDWLFEFDIESALTTVWAGLGVPD